MASKKKTQKKTSSRDESDPIEPLAKHVCDRVKGLRKRKSWTLEQLASVSGVSRSMISQIERGTANPTLGVAFRLAQSFGITLGDLVDTPVPTPKIEVIRADDNSYQFRDDEQCQIRTLSPLQLEKDVEFYQVLLKPGGCLASAAHFEGTREFLTVERGAVRLTSGEESTELKDDDSAHYPADIKHTIENICDTNTVLFLVVIYE